uniref:hypothetical protein n=1 Tax=Shewanella sp. TaxID=50422 RepID=UPI004047B7CC
MTQIYKDEQVWVLQGSEPITVIYKTKQNGLVSFINGKISFTETPPVNTFKDAPEYIDAVYAIYQLSKNERIYKPLLQEAIMLAEKLYGRTSGERVISREQNLNMKEYLRANQSAKKDM